MFKFSNKIIVDNLSYISCQYNLTNFYKYYSKMNLSLNDAKQRAAYKAVDEWVKDRTAIGIGSGSTVVFAVQRLADRVERQNLQIVCIPTSYQAKQLIIESKLKLGNLDEYPRLSVVIDGADEVDSEKILIKGGGGCLLQEKIVASCSDKMIIIADHTKDSNQLGQQYKKGIPIEVVPMAYFPIQKKIQDMFGGALNLRMGVAKAGPCITDNGNFILDWLFDEYTNYNWRSVNREIISIPGVIETGLFIDMAHHIYFGMPDGTIKEKK